MTEHNLKRRRSCWLSLLIGGPMGLFIVFIIIIIFLEEAGELESAMGILGAFVDGIVGLMVALIPALWYAGKRAYADLRAGKRLLLVSFNYSLFVNFIIWLVFVIATIIQNFSSFEWTMLLPAIVLFTFGTLFSTVTIGLVICYFIKRQLASLGESGQVGS
jgi:hypothetical protein